MAKTSKIVKDLVHIMWFPVFEPSQQTTVLQFHISANHGKL